MSKVETTSKVLLELTTRINLGWRGARAKLSILDLVYKPLHGLERVILKQKRTHSSQTDKTAANGNLGQCLKWKPQEKCHQNLPEGEMRAPSSRSQTTHRSWTDKMAANSNLGQCLKWKLQEKCHQNLPEDEARAPNSQSQTQSTSPFAVLKGLSSSKKGLMVPELIKRPQMAILDNA